MPKHLSRRTLLRGAGGIAIGLPFLEIMGTPKSAHGAYGDAAKRQDALVERADETVPRDWAPTSPSRSS